MTTIRLAGMEPERAFWGMTANEDACQIATQQGIDFIAITDELTALHDALELALRRMEA